MQSLAKDGYSLNSIGDNIMADVRIGQKIETGVAGTVKGSATNLADEAKKADAKANAEGVAAKVPEGGKKYKACGASTFNTPGISFNGLYYVTTDKKEIATLDEFVERGFLIEVK